MRTTTCWSLGISFLEQGSFECGSCWYPVLEKKIAGLSFGCNKWLPSVCLFDKHPTIDLLTTMSCAWGSLVLKTHIEGTFFPSQKCLQNLHQLLRTHGQTDTQIPQIRQSLSETWESMKMVVWLVAWKQQPVPTTTPQLAFFTGKCNSLFLSIPLQPTSQARDGGTYYHFRSNTSAERKLHIDHNHNLGSMHIYFVSLPYISIV